MTRARDMLERDLVDGDPRPQGRVPADANYVITPPREIASRAVDE